MELFFLITGIIAIAASLIKLIKKDAWWIRFFDFPQVQIVTMGVIAFAGLLYFWGIGGYGKMLFLGGLSTVLVYESMIIFPYTQLASRESKQKGKGPRGDISIIIANVYMYNRNYRCCLQMIQDHCPDVIILVETDEQWVRHLHPLESSYPHRVSYPLSNTYGIQLYSRLELIEPHVKFLVEADVPSIHTGIRLKNGVVTRLYALHPKPPSPTENDKSTERDAELYMVAKMVAREKCPVIVAGDLNDVAWSHSTRMFQRISRLLDPRKGRGFFNTFHARYPLFRWPLDHVFHSGEFKLVDIRRLGDIGSDHFPMFIELVYDGCEYQNPDLEPADQEDMTEAREKIRAVADE